ncbi:hypothetical protein GCM10011339_35930 [Echinicola rosea]|uniref:Transposase n=1 Tax=Echinicola rosea TaxID=1807691 RepID=A0ABQ1V8J9_9BACT|nr:hypothetical protein GCM10011339_35930 [Echinicola rosea]
MDTKANRNDITVLLSFFVITYEVINDILNTAKSLTKPLSTFEKTVSTKSQLINSERGFRKIIANPNISKTRRILVLGILEIEKWPFIIIK